MKTVDGLKLEWSPASNFLLISDEAGRPVRKIFADTAEQAYAEFEAGRAGHKAETDAKSKDASEAAAAVLEESTQDLGETKSKRGGTRRSKTTEVEADAPASSSTKE